MKANTINKFKELGKKYNFKIEVSGIATLKARNTDKEYVDWIKYNPDTDTISYIGNTDHTNIWLCETRKDFTPEKTLQFINDLNNVFELGEEGFKVRDLIDPEDWQEIANVRDAYKDERYLQ